MLKGLMVVGLAEALAVAASEVWPFHVFLTVYFLAAYSPLGQLTVSQ